MRSSTFAWSTLALIALIVVGCAAPGGGGGSGTTAKQEIVVLQGGSVNSLDQQVTSGRVTQNVTWQYGESLTKLTFTAAGESSIVPLLATSWKRTADTTWEFKLRQGVKFSNGEPFDAAAVKYSIERIQDPNFVSQVKKYASAPSSVNVVDASTVNIVTKTPYPLLPLDLAQVPMVPPKYAASAGPAAFALKPVGTGPFRLVEHVVDQRIVLEANPDYWGGKPKLDKVTFKSAPEAATRSAAIQTGEADVVQPIEVASAATLEGKPGFKVLSAPSLRVSAVTLDLVGHPALKNVKVREALNYAVDKEAIISAVYRGKATLLQGQSLTPGYFGFNPAIKAVPYDPERAKKLLAEAGYANGFDMTIATSRGAYSGDYDSMQAVAGQLAKVGVRVTVKPMEFAVWLSAYQTHSLAASTFVANATPPDAEPMYVRFTTGNPSSMASIPEFDRLLKEASATLDPAKRLQVLQQVAQVEHDQYLNIWLYTLPNLYAVSDKVQDFRLFPTEAMEIGGAFVK